jgi:tripartite-type tricarboxylate transporter receptor subunit TctC
MTEMALSGHADILKHAMKYKRVTINAIMIAIVAHAAGLVGVAAAQGFPTRHVAGIFFEKLTGTDLQFVPYRGGGPALQDLIAGHIDLNMGQVAVALGQIKAGTIKAYGVMAESRISAAPDIPTTDEAGVPGLHLSVWHALWAPKGTPPNIIAKLNTAVVAALADSAGGHGDCQNVR